MANTYQLIASNTVGSGGVSSVTFSSIPSTYTDLVIKTSSRTNRAATYDYYKMKFNSSATGYSDKSLYGTGSNSASEFNNATTYAFNYIMDASTATANTFSNVEFYIPNYASSDYKSYSTNAIHEDNQTTAYIGLTAGLWSNTAAITSISFESGTGANNFVEHTTFYLYGIKNS
jgi:hypothetical protein